MAAESVPEMELNRAVVTTVTAPSPLRNLPMSRLTKSTIFRARPVASSKDPNRNEQRDRHEQDGVDSFIGDLHQITGILAGPDQKNQGQNPEGHGYGHPDNYQNEAYDKTYQNVFHFMIPALIAFRGNKRFVFFYTDHTVDRLPDEINSHQIPPMKKEA